LILYLDKKKKTQSWLFSDPLYIISLPKLTR